MPQCCQPEQYTFRSLPYPTPRTTPYQFTLQNAYIGIFCQRARSGGWRHYWPVSSPSLSSLWSYTKNSKLRGKENSEEVVGIFYDKPFQKSDVTFETCRKVYVFKTNPFVKVSFPDKLGHLLLKIRLHRQHQKVMKSLRRNWRNKRTKWQAIQLPTVMMMVDRLIFFFLRLVKDSSGRSACS